MDVDSHKRLLWTSTFQSCLMLYKLIALVAARYMCRGTRLTKHKSPVLEPQLVAFQWKSFPDLWRLDACLYSSLSFLDSIARRFLQRKDVNVHSHTQDLWCSIWVLCHSSETLMSHEHLRAWQKYTALFISWRREEIKFKNWDAKHIHRNRIENIRYLQ